MWMWVCTAFGEPRKEVHDEYDDGVTGFGVCLGRRKSVGVGVEAGWRHGGCLWVRFLGCVLEWVWYVLVRSGDEGREERCR